MISGADFFTSMNSDTLSTVTGVMLRFNFNDQSVSWIISFTTSSTDNQNMSNWLISSDLNYIYSLKTFNSNKWILHILNAGDGTTYKGPFELSTSINQASGMILIGNSLYFAANSNSYDYLIIYNSSTSTVTSYKTNSISLFRINMTKDASK